MKKTIQKITKLVALSAYLVAYGPAFAAPLQTNETEQGGFWDINEEFPLHFGVKSFTKFPVKYIMRRQALGLEHGLGPFVEWKPLKGIGMQIGALYSFNRLLTFNKTGIMKPAYGWTGQIDSNSNPDLEADGVKFHTFSIPFSFRFYPGDSREFALHAGVRLVIPIGKAKGYEFTKNDNPDNPDKPILSFLLGNKDHEYKFKIKKHLTLDFGFDYTSKSGLIMGMDGLGMQVGYDFSKLLVQA